MTPPYLGLGNSGHRSQRAIASPSPTATALTISTPQARQVYQRDGSGQANIAIAGTIDGSGTVEAQFNGGTWVAIATTSGAGTYSGTLANQPTGQGTLTVRLAHSTGVTATRSLITITDVWLIAGQSNNEGRFTSNYAYTNATFTGLRFRQGDTAWSNYADPSDSDVSARGSVWGPFGDLLSADQNIPLAVVLSADGGTTLVSPADWAKNGTQYNRFIATVQAANLNGAKGIIWTQGETDARNGASQSAYRTAISTFVDNVQTDLGMAGLKLVCTIIGPNLFTPAVADSALDAIRAAQIDATYTDADILFGPYTYDFDVSGDGVHFTDPTPYSQRLLRAIKYHFYGGTEGRGPVYSAAAFNQYRVEVTLTGGVGSTLQNGTSTDGWKVVDANGTRTIVSASTSGKVVTLSVDQALSAPVAVSFCSGNTVAGKIGTIMKDQGAIAAIPPETFINKTVTFNSSINPGSAPPSPTDPAVTVLTGLVSFWRLEEASGDRADQQGANTLVSTGSVGQTTGATSLGNGALFSGTNYLKAASTTNLNLSTEATIACVITPTNNSADRFVLGKYDTSNQRGWSIRRGSSVNSSSMQAVISSNGTTATLTSISTLTAIANNATALVVMQYSANNFIRISVNGGSFVSQAIAFSGFNSSQSFGIGGVFNAGALVTANGFIGTVYWAGFWNKLLSTEEIAYLYNSGSFRQL